jgi:hypothetical protein
LLCLDLKKKIVGNEIVQEFDWNCFKDLP